ncbi:hypothetical protein EAI_08827 [Harpegnathos saltator]|uniref:Uncharacterized protein n=1 Tax=Harpegnathos saltator TaxID=610380 RepID=E2CA13_HARSA|nr:hypothetical protein EAI_08827 [Harpegnathos saltator]
MLRSRANAREKELCTGTGFSVVPLPAVVGALAAVLGPLKGQRFLTGSQQCCDVKANAVRRRIAADRARNDAEEHVGFPRCRNENRGALFITRGHSALRCRAALQILPAALNVTLSSFRETVRNGKAEAALSRLHVATSRSSTARA